MREIVLTFTDAQVRAAEAPLLAAGVPLMRRATAALAEVIAPQKVAGDEPVAGPDGVDRDDGVASCV